MSKIRFYKNGRDVTDDNKNQNYEGVSNSMDDYEIRNLASILERLNKAEAENQKLRGILAMKSENAPDVNSLIQKLMAKDNLAEVELTMSMRMKEYWDK